MFYKTLWLHHGKCSPECEADQNLLIDSVLCPSLETFLTENLRSKN